METLPLTLRQEVPCALAELRSQGNVGNIKNACTRGLLSHGAEMLPELPKTGAGGGAGAFRGVGPASQDGFDTATSTPAPVLSLCPLLPRLRLRAPSRAYRGPCVLLPNHP